MSLDKEREQRWLAYLLGDANPEERERAEAEFLEYPAEAQALRAMLGGVTQWAEEPVPQEPLDLSELDLNAESGSPSRRRAFRPWGGWTAALASAALFLFALTQVQFTLELGDTALHWGQSAPVAKSEDWQEEAVTLAERLQSVEQVTGQMAGQVRSLAVQNAVLEERLHNAALRLVQNQRLEAQTRQRDLQNLLQLASFSQEPNID